MAMRIVCRHDGYCDGATPDERAPFRVWSFHFGLANHLGSMHACALIAVIGKDTKSKRPGDFPGLCILRD